MPDPQHTPQATDVATLRALWPSFEIASACSLGEGWMSRTLLVNDAYVFRFAKHADAAVDTQKEIQLLPKLAPTLSVPIPNFEFVGKQLGSGLPVVGYRRLAGKFYTESEFGALPSETLDGIARQLARCLDELHAFPVAEARRLGVPEKSFYEAFEEDRRELAAANVSLPSNVIEYVERRFSEYLDDSKHFDYAPTLLHADLSPDHLLIDETTPRLCGIIDFGDTSIGDADYEYQYLLPDIGEDFVRLVMQHRGETNVAWRLNKIRLFGTFDHVHSILGGLHFGRRELIEEGICGLLEESQHAGD